MIQRIQLVFFNKLKRKLNKAEAKIITNYYKYN